MKQIQISEVCDGSNTVEYMRNMTSDEQQGREYMEASGCRSGYQGRCA